MEMNPLLKDPFQSNIIGCNIGIYCIRYDFQKLINNKFVSSASLNSYNQTKKSFHNHQIVYWSVFTDFIIALKFCHAQDFLRTLYPIKSWIKQWIGWKRHTSCWNWNHYDWQMILWTTKDLSSQCILNLES